MLFDDNSENSPESPDVVPSCPSTSSVMMSPPCDRSPSGASSAQDFAIENGDLISNLGIDLALCQPLNGSEERLLKGMMSPVPTQQSTVIPQGARPLDHQVGGHLYRNGKVGFLADAQKGVVMKPIQSFPRGMIECAFYSRVFSPDNCDSALLSLRDFMPRFHGVVHLEENGMNYMRLEDVTSLVDSPAAVMDVKMGRHTWDPKSSEEKRKRADGKYPYAKEIGFQITGFRTSLKDDEGNHTMQHFYSDYTRKITPDDLLTKAFRVFFGGDQLRRGCVQRTVVRLQEIGEWFQSQRSFHFYSSSLLLVHSTNAGEDNDSEEAASVKMVDFAHVYPANSDEGDENFLHGLNTLVTYLQRLLDQPQS